MFYFRIFIMTKKKTETKTKKVDLQRAKDIAEVIGTLSQFTPRFDVENVPLFSRTFLLKNILGFTEEEIIENDKLINEESQAILATLEYLKGTPNQVIPENKTTKTKKEKVN